MGVPLRGLPLEELPYPGKQIALSSRERASHVSLTRRQPGDPNRSRGLRPMALRPLLSEEFAFITIRDIQLSMFIYCIGFL